MFLGREMRRFFCDLGYHWYPQRMQPPDVGCRKPCKYWDKLPFPQLAIAGFLNHQRVLNLLFFFRIQVDQIERCYIIWKRKVVRSKTYTYSTYDLDITNILRPAATRNAQRCVPNADPQRKGPKWVSSSADGVDAFLQVGKSIRKNHMC